MNALLSKSERKYRKRFICEHGYNKEEQKVFDEAKKELGCSYKTLYKTVRSGYTYMFMVCIGARRLTKTIKRLGIEAEKAADYMYALNSVAAEAVEENNNYIPQKRYGVTVVKC